MSRRGFMRELGTAAIFLACCLTVAGETGEMFPFVIRANGPSCAADMSFLLPAPALS